MIKHGDVNIRFEMVWIGLDEYVDACVKLHGFPHSPPRIIRQRIPHAWDHIPDVKHGYIIEKTSSYFSFVYGTVKRWCVHIQMFSVMLQGLMIIHLSVNRGVLRWRQRYGLHLLTCLNSSHISGHGSVTVVTSIPVSLSSSVSASNDDDDQANTWAT